MNSPPDGCYLESCEELLRWVILMQGPEASGGRAFYEDEVFRWASQGLYPGLKVQGLGSSHYLAAEIQDGLSALAEGQ